MRLKNPLTIVAVLGAAVFMPFCASAQQPLSIVWEAVQNKQVHSVANIPGSGLVALLRYNKVEIREWSTGNLVRIIDPLLVGTEQPNVRTLSANGNGIIAFGVGNRVYLADAFAGTMIQNWTTPLLQAQETALSPDGLRLAISGVASGTNPRVLIYQLGNLSAAPVTLADTFAPLSNLVRSISFSPDGARLVGGESGTISNPARVRVWPVGGGNPIWRRTLNTNGQTVFASSWTASGLFVGTSFENSSGSVFKLNETDGTDLIPPLATTTSTLALTKNFSAGLIGAYGAAGHYGFADDFTGGIAGYSNTISGSIGTTNDIASDTASSRYAMAGVNRFIIFDAQDPTTAGNPTVQFTTHTPTPSGFSVLVRSVAWSPNGNLVAAAPASNTLRIYDAATGVLNFTVILTTNDIVRALAFSPDSAELAAAVARPSGAGFIRRVNVATGTVTASIDTANPPVSVQYSNDGTRVLVCPGTQLDRRVFVYNLDGTVFAESTDITGVSTSLAGAVFSPDNTRIAVVSTGATKRLHILSVAAPNINVVASSTDQATDPVWCSWRPGSSQVAVGFSVSVPLGGSRIAVWNADNMAAPQIEVGVVPGVGSITSGTYLASNTVVATGPGIYFLSVDGQRLTSQFEGTEGVTQNIAFNPSGDRFIFSTGDGRVAVAESPGVDNRQTLFFQENSTRLIAAWRTNFGNVLLPTIAIGNHDVDWAPRALGADGTGDNSNVYFQNIAPGPGERNLAYWELANSGVPTGSGPLLYRIDPNWVLRGAGDINQDGVADLVFFNTSTNAAAVWFRAGNGSIVGTALIGFAPAGWELGGVGHLGSELTRLVWYNTSTGQVVAWGLSTSGTPISAVTLGFASSNNWRPRGVGNFGADQGLIFFENVATRQVAVWLVVGNTVTATASVGFAPPGWTLIGVGQLNP